MKPPGGKMIPRKKDLILPYSRAFTPSPKSSAFCSTRARWKSPTSEKPPSYDVVSVLCVDFINLHPVGLGKYHGKGIAGKPCDLGGYAPFPWMAAPGKDYKPPG